MNISIYEEYEEVEPKSVSSILIETKNTALSRAILTRIQPHLADGWSVVLVDENFGLLLIATPTELREVYEPDLGFGDDLLDVIRLKLEQLGNPLYQLIEEAA